MSSKEKLPIRNWRESTCHVYRNLSRPVKVDINTCQSYMCTFTALFLHWTYWLFTTWINGYL